MGLCGNTCEGHDILTANEELQGQDPGEEEREIAEASMGSAFPLAGHLQIPGAASR